MQPSLSYPPLPVPAEMAAWDRAAMDQVGIPPDLLMENAARTMLAELRIRLAPLAGRRVLLVAGSGNNGGDAFALARGLHAEGAEPWVLHTRLVDEYAGEAHRHALLARSVGVRMTLAPEIPAEDLPARIYDFAPHAIVDGLLGTGFRGTLRDDAASLVALLNTFRDRCLMVAIDIPSGLDGEHGRPGPNAVRAHLTVTFEAAKLGLVQPEALPYVGELVVAPIGIPRHVKADKPTSHVLLDATVARHLEGAIDPGAHKGSFGHVLIVGGSPGLTGAPMLAGLAALRAGAGLSSVAAPAGLAAELKAGFPDVMLLALGAGRAWTPELAHGLSGELERFDGAGVGPGLGRTRHAARFLAALLELPGRPAMVLDADALYHLAAHPDLFPASLLEAGPGLIVTPHPGEAARLLDTTIPELQERRSEAARELARRYGAVVVLKGAATLVCAAEGPIRVAPFAEPNLAVGGSGDVLTGVVAALLARGLDPLAAAETGVSWHGLAGRLLAAEYPCRGNLALDIANMLPTAHKEMRACSPPKTS